MPAVPFEYIAPAEIGEAFAALAQYGAEAKLLAGGQSLVPMLTLRVARPAVLIDLNSLGDLSVVRRENGHLSIGALVRHRALERGVGALAGCPLLQEAAALIGNVRVRSLGTIGGSLAHADPAAELPAVVRALDGTITARSHHGERTIAAQDFFMGMLSTALEPDEILVAVRLPLPGPRTGYAIEEFSPRAGDFAVAAAVALVRLDPEGRIAQTQVALAGVGPIPCRLHAVERAAMGIRPSRAAFHQIVDGCALEIDPSGDVHASAAYRRHLARVVTVRALDRAAVLAGKPAS
jgi:aerobic carbon-monoxide dehydrogenase medium subunit